jgi:predicted dehydrogenase
MAIYALDRGVNVFMEKPPVISWEQLDRLREAIAASNKKLGFCFQNRYNPAVIKARDLLSSGEAGKVLGARGYVTWNRGVSYYSDPWHGKLALEGGGVLINQAIHTLDLLHCFIGQAPICVDAVMANHRLETEIEVEDTISALVTYPDARMSFYATNSYAEDSPVLMEVQCENMHLRMEGNTLFCKKTGGIWEQIEVEQLKELGKSYWGAGHIVCIEDFYRCIDLGEPFALELPGVEETIRLTLKIYQSARENRTVNWEG